MVAVVAAVVAAVAGAHRQYKDLSYLVE